MIGSVATVYTGQGQTGRARTFAVANDERGRLFNSFQMANAGLYGQIRSVSMFGSSLCTTRLFLFSHPSPWLPFRGEFVEIVNERGAGSTYRVDLADHGFTAPVTSIAIISTNRGAELAQTVSSRLEGFWNDQVAAALAGESAVTVVGGPSFEWRPRPGGTEIAARQRLVVRALGRDHDASFTINFAVGVANRQATAAITSSSVWVGSGPKSGRIRRRLGDAIDGAVVSANAAIANGDVLPTDDLDDLFVLPGSRSSDPGTGVYPDSTTSDSTFIAVL